MDSTHVIRIKVPHHKDIEYVEHNNYPFYTVFTTALCLNTKKLEEGYTLDDEGWEDVTCEACLLLRYYYADS